MKHLIPISLILLVILLTSCNSENEVKKSKNEFLPTWNDSKSKQSILDYVADVTNEQSKNYVAVKDRIAVFDNDGTLWSEKPIYFQFFFAIDRIKQLAPEHPEWNELLPYKAILENDADLIQSFGEKDLLEVVMTSHAGMNTKQFEGLVKTWLDTAYHPTLNKPYTELVFQPMLELLSFLRENEFKTFIVSGGGIEFMRPWVEEIYGIPSDQVIGSSIKTEVQYVNGQPTLNRLPELDFIDDKEGKIIGINKFIGKKPIFCAGNSDGDLAMMLWTASNNHKSMNLYIHHTDSVREWAYDRHSHVGRLDKGMDEATARQWTIVDIQKEWKTVYSIIE